MNISTMEIIEDLGDYKGTDELSLAIGVFDGIHKGHAKVIERAVHLATEKGITPAVLTFREKKSAKVLNMTSFEHKLRLLARFGCLKVFVVRAEEDWFFSMRAEKFIEEILLNKLHSVCITVGENFCFGKKRETLISDALHLFASRNIELNIIPLVSEGEDIISSSLIRSYLMRNDFSSAERLLGRPYSLGGFVKRGTGLGGAKLGIPTANIDVSEEQILLDGVYACRVKIGEEETVYKGVMSVGTNPTVARDDAKKVEIHIFNFQKDIYEEFLEVFPVKKIRDTQKFLHLEALKENIQKDIRKSIDILGP